MDTSAPLQQILGTDKRNPVFTVHREDDTSRLHVFYGAQLLEVIPDDREHSAYKLLVARLYNFGLNRIVLSKTFNVDPKTMKRWGDPNVA